MRAIPLSMRMLSREWRSGELGVLLLALTIAVAALTGVGFLVSRIGAAVAMQASQVLAADLRLQSPQPIAERICCERGRTAFAPRKITSLLSVGVRGRSEPAHRHRCRDGRLSAARHA